MRRTRWFVWLVVVVAMVGAACGEADDPTTATGGDDNEAGSTTAAPTFDAGTTMARIQQKGEITVGVKYDQPGFGQQDPATGDVEGFDVEIAKLIAVAILGGDVDSVEDKIEFVESVSKNREPFIQDGRVDIVVATYTINDTRKQVIDFAGPYFVAKQDIMVRKDDTSIKAVDDLNGKKVCTAKGSTSEKNIRAKAPRADVLLFDGYDECKEALVDERVVAVSTDNTILAGYVDRSPDELKLVDNPFSDEPYGIGLKKGDEAFRDFLNDRLEEIFEGGQWGDAFESTLGQLGLETPDTPTLDRYGAVGGATSSTTGTGGAGGSGSTSTTGASSTSSSTG
ncbi:MAG: glutamate ABC transporter substrate-binding protein [Actinomycetota bacterium]|nr:glutamate ABC transporter substrate-binding protein [Actinomycetota bacterium]